MQLDSSHVFAMHFEHPSSSIDCIFFSPSFFFSFSCFVDAHRSVVGACLHGKSGSAVAAAFLNVQKVFEAADVSPLPYLGNAFKDIVLLVLPQILELGCNIYGMGLMIG